jgi:hypothetical protein
MEPEDEENQYASIRHSNSHRRHVYVFLIGVRAERGGGALQVEMCWVPWRGRNRFGDGEENGRHDFTTADVQGLSDAELATVITSGKNKMPAHRKSF